LNVISLNRGSTEANHISTETDFAPTFLPSKTKIKMLLTNVTDKGHLSIGACCLSLILHAGISRVIILPLLPDLAFSISKSPNKGSSRFQKNIKKYH